MYCGNCGRSIETDANFCGSCGMRTSKPQKEMSGNLSQTIKKEISALPLVTLIGDTVKGASGLSVLQDQLKEQQDDPLLWLYYYEGFVTYKKMNRGVNVARLIYNPVGFAVSKGISTGLNAMDDEYEVFDPQNCLSMALALCIKKIEKKTAEPIHSMIAGKTLFYMGINESNSDKQSAFFLRAIKFFTLAIQTEKNERFVSEYFFYLAQVYGMAGNGRMQYRALNISRKMGFMPSLDLLKKALKERGRSDEQISAMLIKLPSNKINQFKYTYKPDAANRIENSLKFMFSEQSKKMKSTSNRIKKFFS